MTKPASPPAVNLALQGGGAHGAFTWGVLDKLLEDGRIGVAALSGASAGAMNACAAAAGMAEGGAEGARAALARFWNGVADIGAFAPLSPGPLARFFGGWSLSGTPVYQSLNALLGVASPYQFNPARLNPLRDLAGDLIDFDAVRACREMGVFIAATNVETGRVRIFEDEEVTLDALMASACLPELFHAVEIDGAHYWDGGYMGNPPLFPFFHHSPSDDIVIVQVNPIRRPGPPRTADEIRNRVDEINFNSALLHEMRAIDFVGRLLDSGRLAEGDYRRMRLHMIADDALMQSLDASSKLNADRAFLHHLRDKGRAAATAWLAAHLGAVGVRSTLETRPLFHGSGALPTP